MLDKSMSKTGVLTGLFCLVMACWLSSAQASDIEPLEHIKAVAEQFALAQIDDDRLVNIEASAANLDARLQLARCEQALEAFSASAANNLARTTIGIRCTGIRPWTLYVPVRISAMSQAIFTTRPLARGDALLEEYLEIRQVPVNSLPANYFRDMEQIGGLETSRSLQGDAILTLNSVKPRLVIKRGQEVIILASAGRIQIRMNGIALKDGISGELIPVQNTNSRRKIEATVVDSGTVAVKM